MEISRKMEDPFVTRLYSGTPVNAARAITHRGAARRTTEALVAIPKTPTPISTSRTRPKTPITAIRLGPLGPRSQPPATPRQKGESIWSIDEAAPSAPSKRDSFKCAMVADMPPPRAPLPALPVSPTEEAASVKQLRQRLAAANFGHTSQRPATHPLGPRPQPWSHAVTRCRLGPSPPLKRKRFSSELEGLSTLGSAAARVAAPQNTAIDAVEKNHMEEDQTTPKASRFV